MWERSRTGGTRIFFIAHPGQNDDLYCGHSPLRVHNIAFALHCPDLVTPKGNWFLPLCCSFVYLLSLDLSFLLISDSFVQLFPPFHLPYRHFLVHASGKHLSFSPQSFLLLVFLLIYFSCLSLLPLALSLGLHLLCSVSKPPAIAFALQVIHNLSLIWSGAALHSFPVWTLHLYHCSNVFFRSLLSLSWLLFPWISYFPMFCPPFVPSLPDCIPSFSSLSLFIGIMSLTISFFSHDLHTLTCSSWEDVTVESEKTKWIFICLGISNPEYLYAMNPRRVCLLQRNISFD